ncbi:hypothetical protein OAQ71_00090 [bacterium]|nr:hypothetical protein [bacterium]
MEIRALTTVAACMAALTACNTTPEGGGRFYSLGAGQAGEELALAVQVGTYGSHEGERLGDRIGYYGSFAWDILEVDVSPTDLTGSVPSGGVAGDQLREVQTEDVWATVGGTCRVSKRIGLRFGVTAGWVVESRIYDPVLGPLIGGPVDPYLVVTEDEFVLGTEVGIDLIPSGGGIGPSLTYASGSDALMLLLSFWL